MAAGCRSDRRSAVSSDAGDVADTVVMRYARGLTVTRPMGTDDVRLVEISDPDGEHSEVYRYALVRRGAADPAVPDGYERIEVPVRRAMCMTSLQLSNFIALGALDDVVAVTSTRHLFNPDVKARLAEGTIHRIGIEGNFDREAIVALQPDVVLFSPFKRGGYEGVRDLSMTLVPHLGYKEPSPRGQAEWVRLIGMLTGREHQADSIFDGICERYDSLCRLTSGVDCRPVVFCGEFKSGTWYAPGGRSFLARMFEDAGARYFMEGDDRTGGVTMDFETLYTKAHDAPYWRLVNSHQGDYTYQVLGAEDSRYRELRAFRDHGVVYCNMSQVPYYESMPMEPDRVLADFIYVFHPELMPRNYQPKYYRLLP